jgi:hypothetical protein
MNSTQHARVESAFRAPRRAAWLAAACAMLAAASAGGQVLKSKPITGGLESGTDLVTLPAQASGSLAVRECRDCPSLRLEFDSNTRYFIGKEPVSYARLREAAAKGALRLDVSYRLGTRTLTRLRLAAAGNTQ